jgi:hypothetical protein
MLNDYIAGKLFPSFADYRSRYWIEVNRRYDAMIQMKRTLKKFVADVDGNEPGLIERL